MTRYRGRAQDFGYLDSGVWSRAYAFRLDGQDVVIRFGPHGTDFAKDRVMGRLRGRGFYVPGTLDMGQAFHGYFSICERASGLLLDDLSAAEVQAALPSLLAFIGDVGRLRVPGRGGYGVWRPDGRAPYVRWRDHLLAACKDNPRFDGSREKLARSSAGLEPFRHGYSVLESRSVEFPDVMHLIHADLLHRNVFVENNRVSAIIDWGNSLYGDPLYEMAWLSYFWDARRDWSEVDVETEFFARSGYRVTSDAVNRLLCYKLQISLYQQAFNAFAGDGAAIELHAQRTLDLAHAITAARIIS